jgi:multidrug efflux system outer membrane protein
MSARVRVALIGMVMVGLAGCNLAPEYRQPDSPVGAQFPDQPRLAYQRPSGDLTVQTVAARALSDRTGNEADVPWQQFFQDPALKELIALALVGNRDLQQAVARMDQAEAAWGVQRGALYPTLGASLSGSRQRAPFADGLPSTITSQYNAGIAVTAFELDLFGRLRNLSESAFQQYLATREGARTVQIALVADVAIQYYRWRMTQVLKALTEQTLKSRQRSYRLVQARFGRGVANRIEVAQSRSLVDAAAAALARYTRDEQVARNAISVLIGQPIPADLSDGLSIDRLAEVQAIPAGLPSELLQRRPDILAATNQLLAANANIGAARAAFFPTISLTGSFGRVSTSLDGIFSGGTGWAFAPSITMPLFAGGSLQAGLEQAKAAQREAVAAYEQSIQQAFREVADTLAGEATLGAELAARQSETTSAKRFLELSQARFFRGVDSFLDVQIAEVQFFQARQQVVLGSC